MRWPTRLGQFLDAAYLTKRLRQSNRVCPKLHARRSFPENHNERISTIFVCCEWRHAGRCGAEEFRRACPLDLRADRSDVRGIDGFAMDRRDRDGVIGVAPHLDRSAEPIAPSCDHGGRRRRYLGCFTSDYGGYLPGPTSDAND